MRVRSPRVSKGIDGESALPNGRASETKEINHGSVCS
jgi:hypothetical protein